MRLAHVLYCSILNVQIPSTTRAAVQSVLQYSLSTVTPLVVSEQVSLSIDRFQGLVSKRNLQPHSVDLT